MAERDVSRSTGERDVREHLVVTAYELFAAASIRSIGVDKIIATARVAKATFYRHFRSKNDLVVAVLDHHARWWQSEVLANAKSQALSPEQSLLTVFDLLHELIRARGRRFNLIKVVLEMGPDEPSGAAAIEHLRAICRWASDALQEAGLPDPDELAQRWHIIVQGSLVAAAEGDGDAAMRGRSLAALLLDAPQRHHA